MLQSPDHAAGQQDDGKNLLHVGAAVCPGLCAGGRQIRAPPAGRCLRGVFGGICDAVCVVRTVRPASRSGPAGQQLRAQTEQREAEQDAGQVEPANQQKLLLAEKGCGEQRVQRQLSAAGQKRYQKYRQPLLLACRELLCLHDRRDRAAEAEQERHCTVPGETQPPHGAIQRTREHGEHAAAFPTGQTEEQDGDGRYERQHATNAGADAADHEVMQHRCAACALQGAVEQCRPPDDTVFHNMAEQGAEAAKGQPDRQKCGACKEQKLHKGSSVGKSILRKAFPKKYSLIFSENSYQKSRQNILSPDRKNYARAFAARQSCQPKVLSL